MMTLLSIWTTLDNIKYSIINEHMDGMSHVAISVAAILAGMSILKNYNGFVKGDGLDFMLILKPIMILILVANFNTHVMQPLDAVTNIFIRGITDNCSVTNEQYLMTWKENMETMAMTDITKNIEAYHESIAEFESDSRIARFFKTIWEGLKRSVMSMMNITSLKTGALIGGLLYIVAKVLLFMQQVICYFYQIFIGMVGPVIFATSVWPGYAAGIKRWFARYIQLSCWIPAGFLVMMIGLEITSAFADASLAGETGLSATWFMILLHIVALVMISAVPKLATYWIESRGGNDAHGSVTQPARNIARKFIKI
jgi:hypothetical protein